MVLNNDSSWDAWDSAVGTEKPVAEYHKAVLLDVATGTWSVYYHPEFNGKNYDSAKWRDQ